MARGLGHAQRMKQTMLYDIHYCYWERFGVGGDVYLYLRGFGGGEPELSATELLSSPMAAAALTLIAIAEFAIALRLSCRR